MDWYGNRHNEEYIYKRVKWFNWMEHEEYPWITSGSIELSTSSELKVTGSFDFEGYELPDTSDLLRVYYAFDDDTGEHVITPLATLFVAYAELEHFDTAEGIKSRGTLDGSSVLKVLEDKIYGAPYTVTRNSNAIFEAQRIIKDAGLNVEYTPSLTVLSADHTFDSGTTFLEIVDWLCETAGYTPPYPDAMGTVQLKPYSEVLRQDVNLTFENDDKSIMYPELNEANDWNETPNVVKLFYNTDIACIVAEARNITGSRVSLDARGGREQTYYEEIGELPEDANKLQSLIDQADEMIRQLSCDIEYVTFQHAYVPVLPYQAVTINYGDMEWTGTVENTSIELSPSTKAQTKIKRELYDNITVTKSGAVLRGIE